ncbi:Cathepsin L-like peptidase 3 [Frankliniella occidentalis]|nr:procathepsin L-like isoform X2 [Frankliniella occidentalis]XP_052122631.1 procathepsin L-like isoform X2 [Frankliniella occidentalis]XP_052122632.1 procathepsin L-like isoform X2 [Frankliniella occidentalis]XP_052122633.1 procathepsin L-like isoform X2 [Frankliniella occidentalis]XP_052122634.1 procathepsin L-like isoform X2 [Frankliniella occidentalis]XP_052122635.1 procathepsin L-like isoform X2 [Frankliniella occidentalis]KAE8747824.1 Cathepsin L-like peptidase 3 [Frankliniella occident
MKVLIVLAACVVAAMAAIPSDMEIQAHWESFKATHAKTYANAVEEAYRAKVFKENAIRIAKHNDRFASGEVTFKVGYNQYADMHTHEVTEKLNGYRSGLKQASAFVHTASNVSWPWSKKVDWRSKGAVTPIKDQGQCGSCWSFSATGSLEGQLFLKNKNLVSLSEQNLVDCSWDFGNQGCNGGLMDSAFAYIKSNGGIDTEESYPYTAEDGGSCLYKAENNAGVNTGYKDVQSESESALRDAVEKVGPVSVAIDASNWSFQMYTSGIYYEPACSSYSLDHGVLAVGYGSEWPNKEFWIVKNSWGTSWGEEGYIKMARNKKNNCGIATEASYPLV